MFWQHRRYKTRCFVMSMVLELLLTLPVGSCSREAVELSFSCLRRLKTWSKGERRVCDCGKRRPSLSYGQIERCLFAFSVLAARPMTAVCEFFNLLHFRRSKGGGHGAKSPIVNTPMSAETMTTFTTLFFGVCQFIFRAEEKKKY